jgi:hypothetical protein
LDEQTVFLYSISPSASEIHKIPGQSRIYRGLSDQIAELPGSKASTPPDTGVKASAAGNPGLAPSAYCAL